MKPLMGLIVAFFLLFSNSYGQDNKKTLPAKPSEQQEMKADKHLEKEWQQKQLSAKPVLLAEPPANKERVKQNNKVKTKAKCKCTGHHHFKKD